MSNIDPTDLRVQLEVSRERLKYSEEKVRQQEKILIRVHKDLDQKEAELKQIRIEREDLRIKWEVLQRDFNHLEHSLAKATQANTKKKKMAQLQGLLASLIFLFSSVLVNLGTTMLTSLPPNSLGWFMIALATATYLVAALMATVFASEGGNS